VLQNGLYIPGIFVLAIRDWNNLDLYRSQPDRKGSCIMLRKNAYKPLHRSEQRAVNHDHLVRLRVGTDVIDMKPGGKIEVELKGAELPGSPQRIDQLNIDLRTVKGRLTFCAFQFPPSLTQHLNENLLSTFPVIGTSGVILRSIGIPH